MKLSIIIPVFNEENYILNVLKKVNEQKKKFEIEIIVVDDGSTDGTKLILKENKQLYDKLVNCIKNKGKGNAISQGVKYVTGDYVLIQDADLEYNPEDYEKLLQPVLNYNAEVVYGSRFKGSEAKRILYFKNRIANFLLSLLASLITNINFSDVETGYKLIKTDLIKNLNLKEKSFGIEIELTIKLSKKNVKFYEVGISYNGRSYEQGKKIKLKDGFIAVYCIFYYKFFT